MAKTKPEIAVDLFREGYNCAQAVLVAYSDQCKLTKEMAESMSAPFGGGLGRQREVCGAVSGMCMVLGLMTKFDRENKHTARLTMYETTQKMCEKFKKHHGSIVCREILGERTDNNQNHTPSPRTAQYYATRPCEKCIEDAAIILDEQFSL